MSPDLTQERRRIVDASVKEDLAALHETSSDTLSAIAQVSGHLTAYNDQLVKLVTEMNGFKGSGAEIAAIHDLSTTISDDLQALQQTVGQSYNQIVGQSEAIMALLDTLQSVFDAQEAVRHAVLGLTQQVHDHPCPWGRQGATLTPEHRMESMDVLVSMIPRLELVIQNALDAEGRDGKTGDAKWWVRKWIDRLKEEVITVFLAAMAGLIIGSWGSAILGYLNPQVPEAVVQIQRQLNDKISNLERDRDAKELIIKRLEQERELRENPTQKPK